MTKIVIQKYIGEIIKDENLTTSQKADKILFIYSRAANYAKTNDILQERLRPKYDKNEMELQITAAQLPGGLDTGQVINMQGGIYDYSDRGLMPGKYFLEICSFIAGAAEHYEAKNKFESFLKNPGEISDKMFYNIVGLAVFIIIILFTILL